MKPEPSELRVTEALLEKPLHALAAAYREALAARLDFEDQVSADDPAQRLRLHWQRLETFEQVDRALAEFLNAIERLKQLDRRLETLAVAHSEQSPSRVSGHAHAADDDSLPF